MEYGVKEINKHFYHVDPLTLDAGNFVQPTDRKNVYANQHYNDDDKRSKLPVNIGCIKYNDTQNDDKIEYE